MLDSNLRFYAHKLSGGVWEMVLYRAGQPEYPTVRIVKGIVAWTPGMHGVPVTKTPTPAGYVSTIFERAVCEVVVTQWTPGNDTRVSIFLYI